MTGKFPKQCKTAHITPVYKMAMNWIPQIIDQFHLFLTEIKSLRKVCTLDYISFQISLIASIKTNTVFEIPF